MRPKRETKRLAIALTGVLLLLLALAPAALAGVFLPERGGSANADDTSTLYAITLYIGAVIFVIVEGTLIWALVKYRRRRGGPEPAQIRGNTPLELGWTLGASAIVIVLAVVTFLFLDDIKDPPAADRTALADTGGAAGADTTAGKFLEIGVNGQQYLWRFDYPGKEALFTYHTMVVPEDVTIRLEITSSDVAHSWWIPKLGGKKDAIPGHTNDLWFKATEPGYYVGACAELCGENHADMRAAVRVLPLDEYRAWADAQRRDIKAAQDGLAEQRKRREAADAREQAAGELDATDAADADEGER